MSSKIIKSFSFDKTQVKLSFSKSDQKMREFIDDIEAGLKYLNN